MLYQLNGESVFSQPVELTYTTKNESRCKHCGNKVVYKIVNVGDEEVNIPYCTCETSKKISYLNDKIRELKFELDAHENTLTLNLSKKSKEFIDFKWNEVRESFNHSYGSDY